MQLVRWRHVSLVFQGAMNSLDPVKRVDAPDRRGDPPARARRRAPRDVRARIGELLDHGRADAGARAPLPAPALGRPAPARDDRARARVPAVAGDRRRADHRARRGDAGADPGAARAAARGARPGADPDLARPRACWPRPATGSRSCTPGGSSRPGRCATVFDDAPAPLHQAPAGLAAGDRRGARAGRRRSPAARPTRASCRRAAASGRAARTRPSAASRTRRCARCGPAQAAACHFAPWSEWPAAHEAAVEGAAG